MRFSKVIHAVVFVPSSAVCRFPRCATMIAVALARAFCCSIAQTMCYDTASTSPPTADIQAARNNVTHFRRLSTEASGANDLRAMQGHGQKAPLAEMDAIVKEVWQKRIQDMAVLKASDISWEPIPTEVC